MRFKGVAYNLNEVIGTGIYMYTSNTTNSPDSFGVVLQFGNVENPGNIGNDTIWVYQLAFPTTGSSIFLRVSINGAAWSNWRKVSLS